MMKGKFLAVMIIFLLMGLGAFVAYVMGRYGDFTAIPWWDVLMWIFQCVLGILLFLVLAVIFLVYSALNGEEEPEPRRKRVHKKKAAKKLNVKAPDKQPKKKRKEKKLKENGIGDLPQIEYPSEWDEEEFE